MTEEYSGNENENQLESLDKYQMFVRSTKTYDREFSLMYPVLGLANEAGEVAGKLKKIIRDDGGQLTPERLDDLVSELGDVLWYVTAVADDLGITISDVFQVNFMKISDRAKRGVIKGSGDHR